MKFSTIPILFSIFVSSSILSASTPAKAGISFKDLVEGRGVISNIFDSESIPGCESIDAGGCKVPGQSWPIFKLPDNEKESQMVAASHVDRGKLKEAKKDHDGALAEYDRAISVSPKFAKAYYHRANLRYNHNHPGTIEDYNKAIELSPQYAEAYSHRGHFRAYKLNDMAGALADFDRAIAFEPKFAEAYYERGFQKARTPKQMEDALKDLDKAIELNPQYAEAYRERSLVKKQLNLVGSEEDAIQSNKLFRARRSP